MYKHIFIPHADICDERNKNVLNNAHGYNFPGRGLFCGVICQVILEYEMKGAPIRKRFDVGYDVLKDEIYLPQTAEICSEEYLTMDEKQFLFHLEGAISDFMRKTIKERYMHWVKAEFGLNGELHIHDAVIVPHSDGAQNVA